MRGDDFMNYYIGYFFVYAFIGWIIEVSFQGVNTGFRSLLKIKGVVFYEDSFSSGGFSNK